MLFITIEMIYFKALYTNESFPYLVISNLFLIIETISSSFKIYL